MTGSSTPRSSPSPLPRGEVGILSLAARFAAKEAFGKAIGSGLRHFALREIAVLNDSTGKPFMMLTGAAEAAFKDFGGQPPGLLPFPRARQRARRGDHRRGADMSERQKLTFFEKKQTVCPVCDAKFFREDLLSGGGRLIAGDLTKELRRLYEPSKKYGEFRPLLYPVTVCPVCYFAAFPQDFAALPDAAVKKAEVNADERRESMATIFPQLDFTSPRTLREGMASYYFAVMCYDFYDKRANPTFKAGLVRAARRVASRGPAQGQEPGENWDHLALIFYRKAHFYYQLALERESAGQEPFDAALAFGPDLDKNYGYYGVIYLAAYLDFKYGPTADPERRVASLQYARRMMAKIFGVGKSSKNRPVGDPGQRQGGLRADGRGDREAAAGRCRRRRIGGRLVGGAAARERHGGTQHQAHPRLRRHGFPGLAAPEAGQDRPGRDAGGLARMHGHPVHVLAAGRTDSGVHATGQVANFRSDIDSIAREPVPRRGQCLSPAGRAGARERGGRPAVSRAQIRPAAGVPLLHRVRARAPAAPAQLPSLGPPRPGPRAAERDGRGAGRASTISPASPRKATRTSPRCGAWTSPLSTRKGRRWCTPSPPRRFSGRWCARSSGTLLMLEEQGLGRAGAAPHHGCRLSGRTRAARPPRAGCSWKGWSMTPDARPEELCGRR